MDLEIELLRVLDSPSSVWDAMFTNLEPEPRTALLILTTCKTPVSLVDWQTAIAQVSLTASIKFEASLRVLDDNFVSISRGPRGTHSAEYRNPSMDEFCAEYLHRNVGFATKVASSEPSLRQINRLIELATARHPSQFGQWRYPDLHAVLIAQPSRLMDSLIRMLPLGKTESYRPDVATTLLLLVGAAPESALEILVFIRSQLLSWLKARRFQRDDHFLFNTLDDGIAAKGVVRVLGDDLDEFYEQLWTSANGLDHFDTMVDFDNVLQRPGEVAEWTGQFQELTENWIENAGDDTSTQYYDKIAEHLDLGDFSRLQEFEEAAAQAAEDEREPDDDEDGWSRSPQGEAPAIDYEGREIDTLFATLADAPSRPT